MIAERVEKRVAVVVREIRAGAAARGERPIDGGPIGVGAGSLIEMFVNRGAGQVVADGDCALEPAIVKGADLLAGADRQRDIPIALPA